MGKFNKKIELNIDCNRLYDQLTHEPEPEHQFDTTHLPQRTEMTPWAIKMKLIV